MPAVVIAGPATVVQDTAANLNAKVEGQGTAGTPSGGVVSIQGVSGAVAMPVSAAALPLPSGAATEATLAAIKDTAGIKKIVDAVTVVDGGGSLTIDGSVTANLGTVAGLALDATLTGGTQKAIIRGGAKGTTPAADVTSEAIDTNRQGLHVILHGGTGGGGGPVRILDANGNALDTAEAGTPAGDRGLMVEGWERIAGKAHRLAVDSQGRLAVVAPGDVSVRAGFAAGYVVLSDTAVVAVRATAYTEQSSNAQRSLVSSSVNDAAAGTGARTVRITYYDQNMAGPFTETVTLNGTSAVNTVASNICYIEKLEVLTVGSTGANVGAISLKAATAGGGATIWSIAVGDLQTQGAHHYVPAGAVCCLTGLQIGIKGGDTTSGFLKAVSIPVSNNAERIISDYVRAPLSGSSFRSWGTALRVAGPSKITAYVAPDSTSSRTYFASFDYYEQDS